MKLNARPSNGEKKISYAIIESGETGEELLILQVAPAESNMEYVLLHACKQLELDADFYIITHNARRMAPHSCVPLNTEDDRAPVFVLHNIRGKTPEELDVIFGPVQEQVMQPRCVDITSDSKERLRNIARVQKEPLIARLYRHVMIHMENSVATTSIANAYTVQLFFTLDSTTAPLPADTVYMIPFWNVLVSEQPRDTLVHLLDLLKQRMETEDGFQIATSYLLKSGTVKWIVEF